MTRRTTATIGTVCAGMAVGAAAYMMSGNKNVRAKSKKLRRQAGRTLRQVGEIIGSAGTMIR